MFSTSLLLLLLTSLILMTSSAASRDAVVVEEIDPGIPRWRERGKSHFGRYRSKRGSDDNEPSLIQAVEFTSDDHKFAVAEHNKKRGLVDPPATDMIRLEYDAGLAETARQYSRGCVYEHSSGLTTPEFDYLGENLFATTQVKNNVKSLARAVHLWFDEHKYWDYETSTCQPGKKCGHYTEMVWATNHAIGCGMSICKNLRIGGKFQKRGILLVCHYGPGGNYRGEKPYTSGETCSACPPDEECVCAGKVQPTTPPPNLPPTTPDHPKTIRPYTKAPETKAPETKAPETKAPETKAPDSKAPETKKPKTVAPEKPEEPKTKAPKSDDTTTTEAAKGEKPEDETATTPGGGGSKSRWSHYLVVCPILVLFCFVFA